jgi:hypothetical protein
MNRWVPRISSALAGLAALIGIALVLVVYGALADLMVQLLRELL